MEVQELRAEYDMISPVTGNKCVLAEADPDTGITSFMCMESGYVSAENMINESDHVMTFEQMNTTELMRDLKMVDADNRVWYPTFIQMPFAMLYCEGESVSAWHWSLAEIVTIEGEERLKYPVPGKDGEYFTSKLDTDNAKVFDKLDFENAFAELYSIIERRFNEAELRDTSA